MDKSTQPSAPTFWLLHEDGRELGFQLPPGCTWADAARELAEQGYTSVEVDGHWQALTAKAA